MPLINFEINLTWSANCVISEVNSGTTFAITNTKLYVPVVTLSTKDNDCSNYFHGNKRLQCYDRRKKYFWSSSKKWYKNM